MSLVQFFWGAFLALTFCSPAWGTEPNRFELPLDCKINQTCWVVNYVDVDPAPGSVQDIGCGKRTYDGHRGTDVAIADVAAMKRGFKVLAVKDGTVIRTRDGAPDQFPSAAVVRELKTLNRGCGNGVVVDHGGGLQTLYCHLKQGSIQVKPGQGVKAGQALGQLGYSGIAEFPHVHLSVLQNGQVLDPFTGKAVTEGCGKTSDRAMWNSNLRLTYEPVVIYAAGFRDTAPDFKAILQDAGSPTLLSQKSPLLAFWVGLFGVIKGDEITLEIRDPEGKVFARQAIQQDKTRARQFYFVGRKFTQPRPAKTGTYVGTVRLLRKSPSGSDIRREQVRQVRIR